MTHERSRAAAANIAHALSYTPCVGVLGMRQVGKSTLLRHFATTYHTFDDDSFLRRFDEIKTSVLEHSRAPVALDEIQKHPPAFDALKLSIDRKKHMGRFLVSGSVRFSSRKQIRESLTGRIVTLEIFPLSLAECHGRPACPWLGEICTRPLSKVLQRMQRRQLATPSEIEHYLNTGGLPGICFRRDSKVRAELFEQHIDTLLRRDIHLVHSTRLSFAQLRGILVALCEQQGLPVNVSRLARQAGCSVPTARTALAAMEGLFLIRPYGKSWFIEDAGLARHLGGDTRTLTRMKMISAAYYELRLQQSLHLRNEAVLRPYTTRGGIDVPFFFEFRDGFRLAILIDASDRPSEKSLKSITWMKKRFTHFRAVILTGGAESFELNEDAMALPLNWIF